MLVLSRVAPQLISIGDTISVRILAVSGDSVRIGVEAPRSVTVHRSEVYERIQQEKKPGKRS
ncbi:carbon storage regulator CsrA [Pseudomonas violetae]|jgi:carbon storage regulator|uniref:Translational regulator CsrA n=1 Tax=Pseudomonas violetae TaxID=2915813 RepID=A0ABT0F4R0_9PSED|nr:carbon storage regulator CsrA [Pseudomonas violetae]MCK1792991.1 carbon storage regulator CsrA [Pseudomonas violetae]